jgi:riboflavin synthase
VFSGIVEGVGRVERVGREAAGLRLSIHAGWTPDPGASISVSGVCLTVERAAEGTFEAVAVPETTSRTTLGRLVPGSRVNLERALKVGDPLGGHWVQGHVDAVAPVVSVAREGADVRVGVEVPRGLLPYVAGKGSIAIDGVSLTVAAVRDPVATVALVPYTLEHTIASEYTEGAWVNLEVDLVARYLERLLAARGLHPAAEAAALPGKPR